MAEGVLLTPDAAQRMANATRRVEKMGVDVPSAGWYPYVPDDSGGVKLCKTTAKWNKGTSTQLTEYAGNMGSETPIAGGNTITAWNKFANVDAGKWVMVCQVGSHYYLISAEC
jgi:hypothetical protein